MFLVGSKGGSHRSTSAQSVSLTDLLGIGGTSLALREDDMVLVTVVHAMATTANRTLAQLTPSGYSNPTGLSASVQANDTHAVSLGVAYKRMGATPDTTISIPAAAATTNSISYVIEVWRGVDWTTPFAGVTPTTASAGNTGLANPPSITTPATPKGCVVVGCFGAAVAAASAFTNTGATPYDTATNLFKSATENTATNRSVAGMGAKRGLGVSTAFDAAITGSTTTNTGSWAAVSLVLKPDQSLPAASTVTDDFTSDTLAAGIPDDLLESGLTTVNVTGGELVIQPPSSTAGDLYNGRYTDDYYSIRGDSIYVAMTQAPNRLQEQALFGFVSDIRAAIGFGVQLDGNGGLTIRRGLNGADLTGTTYNPTNHFWLKLYHDDTTDTLKIDGAPNNNGSPGSWTNLLSVARPADVDVDCGRIFFAGGTYQSVASPSAIKFDGLNTNLSSGVMLTVQGASSTSDEGAVLLMGLDMTASMATSSATVTSVPILGPKTPLVLASAVSASVEDQVTLGTDLIVASSASLSTTTTPTLSPKTTLTLASAASVTEVGNVTLSARWALALASAASTATLDAVTLTIKFQLTLQAATSTATVDNVVLTSKYQLTAQVAISESISANVTLSPRTTLGLAGAVSLSALSSPTLAINGSLGLQAPSSLSVVDGLNLTQHHVLMAYPTTSRSTTATLGTELVTNGDFTVNATGWTDAGDANPTIVDEHLKISSGVADFAEAWQVIAGPLPAGKYRMAGTMRPSYQDYAMVSLVGPELGGYVYALYSEEGENFSVDFDLLVPGQYFTIFVDVANDEAWTKAPAGEYALFDNISVRRVVADEIQLAAKTQLTPAEVRSLAEATTPTLEPVTELTPQAAASLSAVDLVTLVTRYALTAQSAASLAELAPVDLTQHHVAAIQSLISATMLDFVDLAPLVIDTPADRQIEVGDATDVRAIEVDGGGDRAISLDGGGVRAI